MYSKIFEQIFDSTLAEDYQTRHIFMDLLVLADRKGVVDMTIEAVSRRINVPIDLVRKAIAELGKADTNSRTPSNEGRRIVPLSPGRTWGWQIVNFEEYHKLRDNDARRENNRRYKQEQRKRERKTAESQHAVSTSQHAVSTSQQPSAMSAHVDVDVDVDVDLKSKNKKTSGKCPKDKKPFGELQNVFLTHPEWKKLQDKLGGPKEAMFWIDKLGGFIPNKKGSPYKSHYTTWASWGRDWWLKEGKRLFESTLTPEERTLRAMPSVTEQELDRRLGS